MKDHTGEAESLNEEAIFTEEKFNDIVEGMDLDDWILANAARLIYKSGLRKNEIMDIKIGNVQIEGEVVSEIKPFLPETTKAYSKMPIIVNDESKKIIDDHIKKLTDNGYHVDEDSHLFPNKKTKGRYVDKTLNRHFKKHFDKMTFDDLRAYGYLRYQKQLEGKHISSLRQQKELKKFSRHSRSSTTKSLISWDVQKAGKYKKKDLPWESIVKSIERLPIEINKKDTFKKYLKDIQDRISAIEEIDIRESLNQLLNKYYSLP
jgi:integrase